MILRTAGLVNNKIIILLMSFLSRLIECISEPSSVINDQEDGVKKTLMKMFVCFFTL